MCKFKNIVMLALAATMLTSEVAFAAPGDDAAAAIYTAPAKRRNEAEVQQAAERIQGQIEGQMPGEEEEVAPEDVAPISVRLVFDSDEINVPLVTLFARVGSYEKECRALTAELARIESAKGALPAAKAKLKAEKQALAALPDDDSHAAERAAAVARGEVLDRQVAQFKALTKDYEDTKARINARIQKLRADLTTVQTAAKTAAPQQVAIAGRAARLAADRMVYAGDDGQKLVAQAEFDAIALTAGYLGMTGVTSEMARAAREAHHDYVVQQLEDMNDAQVVHALNDAEVKVPAKAETSVLRALFLKSRVTALLEASAADAKKAADSLALEGKFVRAVLVASTAPTEKMQREEATQAAKALAASASEGAVAALDSRKVSVTSLLRVLDIEGLGAIALDAFYANVMGDTVKQDESATVEDLFTTGEPAPAAARRAAPSAAAASSSQKTVAPAAPGRNDSAEIFKNR